MQRLPAELILHITLFLDPPDTVPLQLASRHFHKITRDNGLWKELCLKDSHSDAARRRRDFLSNTPIPIQEPRVFELQRAVARSASHNSDTDVATRNAALKEGAATARAMACWDPTYPGERVDWYGEYIARHAPLSISWLQQPNNDASQSHEKLETRGLGLLKDHRKNIVVAPLDDGSVCLWNIGEEDAPPDDRDGSIMARSRPSLLSVNGPEGTNWQNPSKSRAKMTSTGVVECVSVDRARSKAYFAVQSGLNEVDLNTLQISSYDRYPFSISALSEATYPVPLTVGTTLSLHMHDPRIGNNGRAASCSYFTGVVDNIPEPATPPATDPFFPSIPVLPNDSQRPSPRNDLDINYAPLFQPLPLSILHLNPSSTLYVAGRFPSILQYDRRFFPKLASTIHSGGSLCSITSLPTPNASTLAAAGEYNGKGSLELYPLTPSPLTPEDASATPVFANPTLQTRNRTSASSSKLLSLTPHGTRLLFSDSGGQLKWLERDGSTLVRRWNMNTDSTSTSASPFDAPSPAAATGGIFATGPDPNEGDVARKLLPVSARERSEVLLWTGEKVGVLGCRRRGRFGFEGADGGEAEGEGEEVFRMDEERGTEERRFERMMRRALERQADEVRFMGGLGLR